MCLFHKFMSTLQARRKNALRETILAAAEKIFASRGYEGFSMRRLAAAIGYSPTAIYLHFKNKADLLHALHKRSFAAFEAKAKEKSVVYSDSTAALRAALTGYIRYGRTYPHQYAVSFHLRAAAQSGEGDPGLNAFGAFGHLVEAFIADRAIPVDAEEATQCLWAGIHGLTSLYVTYPDFPWKDQDALAGRMADMLLAGLLATKETAP